MGRKTKHPKRHENPVISVMEDVLASIVLILAWPFILKIITLYSPELWQEIPEGRAPHKSGPATSGGRSHRREPL